MKHNKKSILIFIALLLSVLSVFLLTSCNSTSPDTDEKTSNLTILSFNSQVELQQGQTTNPQYFSIDKGSNITQSDIDFISEDESIAVVEYDSIVEGVCIYYTIKGISEGETKVYFKTKDGKSQSDKITVTVTAKPKENEDDSNVLEQESTDASIEEQSSSQEIDASIKEQSSSQEIDASIDTPSSDDKAITNATDDETHKHENTDQNTEQNTEVIIVEKNYEIVDEVFQNTGSPTYILNTNTKKFHEVGCGSVKNIKPKNYAEHFGTRDDAIAMGFKPCGNCKP